MVLIQDRGEIEEWHLRAGMSMRIARSPISHGQRDMLLRPHSTSGFASIRREHQMDLFGAVELIDPNRIAVAACSSFAVPGRGELAGELGKHVEVAIPFILASFLALRVARRSRWAGVLFTDPPFYARAS